MLSRFVTSRTSGVRFSSDPVSLALPVRDAKLAELRHPAKTWNPIRAKCNAVTYEEDGKPQEEHKDMIAMSSPPTFSLDCAHQQWSESVRGGDNRH